MSQAERKGRRDDGGDTVGAVPRGHAQGLLGATVPLRGDDGEQRETAGLEEAEEEARGEEGLEVMAGRERGGRDAPAEEERRHQDPVRHLDDEDARERLPGQLRDGRHRPQQRVLAAREPRRLHQAEGCRVAKHRLVEDLQEIHPHEDRQDHRVCPPLDALVLFSRVSD